MVSSDRLNPFSILMNLSPINSKKPLAGFEVFGIFTDMLWALSILQHKFYQLAATSSLCESIPISHYLSRFSNRLTLYLSILKLTISLIRSLIFYRHLKDATLKPVILELQREKWSMQLFIFFPIWLLPKNEVLKWTHF